VRLSLSCSFEKSQKKIVMYVAELSAGLNEIAPNLKQDSSTPLPEISVKGTEISGDCGACK